MEADVTQGQEKAGGKLAGRILAAKPGRWVRLADGSESCVFHGDVTMGLRERLGKWRVRGPVYGAVEDFWEAGSRDEAASIARAASACLASGADWEWRRIEATFPLPDGLTARIEKTSGQKSGRAAVIAEDGRPVGSYLFFRTGWPASFVLGTETVNGSVRLDEGFRGRGICRALYDAVEKALGVPLVPHGRNMVPGALTASSSRFWEKRAAERPVAGHRDPDADARAKAAAEASAYLDAERTGFMKPEFAAAMALLTGWKLLGAARDGGGTPVRAWCVTEDGDAFTSTGRFVPDEREGAVREFDPSAVARTEAPGSGFFFPVDREAMKDMAAAVLERHGVTVTRLGPRP